MKVPVVLYAVRVLLLVATGYSIIVYIDLFNFTTRCKYILIVHITNFTEYSGTRHQLLYTDKGKTVCII